MSQTPSGQNVATMSSVRPSSSACVYAARVARIPSTTSAYVMSSLPLQREIDDRSIEGTHVDGLQGPGKVLVGKAGEEAVDGPLEVRDVALEPAGQAHVVKASRVQTSLLPRQVREVLRGDRRPARIVALPRLGRRRAPRLLPWGIAGEGPDVHQRLLRSERAE